MTRGEMRTLVRIRVNDTNSVRWTDAQADNELNQAAREIARQMSRYQNVNYTFGSESFTTVADDQTYALSASDIRRIWKVQRTDVSPKQPAVQINELDEMDVNSNFYNGYWHYFLTRNPTTKAFTINFPYAGVAAGMTFLVTYVARLAEIATGSGSDGSSYTMIDEDFHDLVVQQCCVNLLGQDSSLGQLAYQKLGELREELMRDLEATTTPNTIQQEWY